MMETIRTLGTILSLVIFTSMTQVVSASGSSSCIVKIPIDINEFSKGWSVSNVMLYLNSTDGHYHVKGMLKNTLPETRSGFESILVSFEDRATNSTVDTESGSINRTLDPGASVAFDIGTMYTVKQANQFKFMEATITP
ncbi:MAG: hypothetical protein WBE34_01600 [Candidatus Nitrosopolaris sp.]